LSIRRDFGWGKFVVDNPMDPVTRRPSYADQAPYHRAYGRRAVPVSSANAFTIEAQPPQSSSNAVTFSTGNMATFRLHDDGVRAEFASLKHFASPISSPDRASITDNTASATAMTSAARIVAFRDRGIERAAVHMGNG
jgi:hypothetical protein